MRREKMRKWIWVWMAFVLILAASPASSGTKWTHDKEGTGDQVDSLARSRYGGQYRAYYVFTTIEESNWLKVPKGFTVNICGTADITDEAANGVEYTIMKSTLALNETPDDNYSEIFLGVTFTGYGTGACAKWAAEGWYKINVTDGPDANSGMVSILVID